MIETQPNLMAAVAVAVCTPPLGLGLASILFKKSFTVVEHEAGKAAFVMGSIGITEGAIPFAAADPLRVIPAIMIGGAVGSVTSLLLSSTSTTPWGGLIVLPVVGNPIGYIIAVIAGTVVTALAVKVLKSIMKEKSTKADKTEIDITFE